MPFPISDTVITITLLIILLTLLAKRIFHLPLIALKEHHPLHTFCGKAIPHLCHKAMSFFTLMKTVNTPDQPVPLLESSHLPGYNKCL